MKSSTLSVYDLNTCWKDHTGISDYCILFSYSLSYLFFVLSFEVSGSSHSFNCSLMV